MPEYQLRVIEEQKQLRERMDKLAQFIRFGAFESLPEVEQSRLKFQFKTMELYEAILLERIANF
jgi:hypothetical protein